MELTLTQLEKPLLLLPPLAILRGTCLLRTLLAALPLGVITLSRSAPLAGLTGLTGLSLLDALLLFQTAPLFVR